MAERIVPANRNQGDPRLDGVDELERRGVARSVVPNLDDICMEVVSLSEQSCLTGLAGIAHEEFAEAAIAEHNDDAVFVYVVAGVGEKRNRWREDVEYHPIAREPSHAASRKNDRHMVRASRCNTVTVSAPAIPLNDRSGELTHMTANFRQSGGAMSPVPRGFPMSWEAVSAIASIASAFIVLVAAIAAVRQLRHMRLANQLSSYFQVMAWFQSAEGTEARRFLASLDLSDRVTLLAVTTPVVDHRLSAIGSHYQNVARLLNLGVLDDSLFGSYYDMVPRVWNELKPIAALLREQTGSAIWLDFEYLAYRERKQRILAKLFRRYPVDFVNAANLGDAFAVAGAGSIGT